MKTCSNNIEGIERKSSNYFNRQKGGTNKYGEDNICFISPRKIAFFKEIDVNCLNEKEK